MTTIRCPNCKQTYELEEAWVDKAPTTSSDDAVDCPHCSRSIRRADLMDAQRRGRSRSKR